MAGPIDAVGQTIACQKLVCKDYTGGGGGGAPVNAYTKQGSDAKYVMKQEYDIQSNNLLLIKQEVSNVENGNHISLIYKLLGS